MSHVRDGHEVPDQVRGSSWRACLRVSMMMLNIVSVSRAVQLQRCPGSKEPGSRQKLPWYWYLGRHQLDLR